MKRQFTTTKEIETFINSFTGATYHYYHYNTETKVENVFFRATPESAKAISEELGVEIENTNTKWYKFTVVRENQPVAG
jgi:hypothetical protein